MSRLERWSRRKRGAGDETPLDAPADGDSSDEVSDREHPATPPPTAETSTEIEEGSLDAELPDPDTLAPEDDFKSFLLPGVSPELKRRALRRMFTASQYNVRDGLDDYDLDYTQMRTIGEDVSSGLRHWMERLTTDETEADENTTASAAPDTTPDSPPAESEIAAAETSTPDPENDTGAEDDKARVSDPGQPRDRSV